MHKHSKKENYQELIFLITELSNYINNVSKEISNDLGTTFNVIKVLSKIYGINNLTLNSLSNKTSIDKGNLSKMLDRLENKQLIRRINGISDQRKRYIFLTEKGLDLVTRYEVLYNEELIKLLVNLKKEDLANLFTALKILNN
ncbi:MarR family transcriptional regulator [Mammaliicoccus sciuri]|uniref:MarR family winged helix-turn-helix transcriptional regulator n=1 Tax=Mammaliicoccus sciuri TaxID=1296 RepID=UPI0037917FDF